MNGTLIIFLISLVLSAIVYPKWGGTEGATIFGNVVQVTSLIIASLNLRKLTSTYAPGDFPRKAWGSLGLGMSIWIVAQLVEMYNETILRIVSYGTIADLFWLVGYLPLIYGVFLLLKSLRASGLPLGSRASYAVLIIVLIALYGLLFQKHIWENLADAQRPLKDKVLDFSYPTFDFVLCSVSVVLLRISWMMRGGSLARAWILLGVGFILLETADILLSSMPALETNASWAMDILYFSSYFLVALAATSQLRASAQKT
jgi:hypothetical protein